MKKTHIGQTRAERGGRQVIAGAAPADAAMEFKLIPRGDIDPSKTNPRKHFDEDYLQQLAASIREKGIVEPLVVRPKGKRFELVVGECRHRAAVIAQLEELPCVVRELTVEQAMEIQIIENLHRQDLTPLEEAAGFRALIKTNPDKHSATTLAARVGKSPSWVWDLMKLLDLIPEAKKLLDEGLMTVNHAIPIARLTPAQQNRVITNGLFVSETASLKFDDDPEKVPGKYDQLKAKTVRELAQWIALYIRFDVKHAAAAAPLLFETTAEKVDEAAALPGRGKKVVAITRLSYVQPEAKDESDKTFLDGRWLRADGTKKTTHVYPNKWVDSPECNNSVMGVVVVGSGQGEAFKVCIAREKCEIHWGKEIKAKAAREKKSARGKGSTRRATAESKWEAQQRRDQAQRQKREERFKVFGPALKKATLEKLSALPANLPKAVFQKLLKENRLPKDTKPLKLALALVTQDVKGEFSFLNSYRENSMTEWARALGVNVKALEPREAKAQTSGAKQAKPKK
jgi:ParB/RepB/Spo0J family partition protein